MIRISSTWLIKIAFSTSNHTNCCSRFENISFLIFHSQLWILYAAEYNIGHTCAEHVFVLCTVLCSCISLSVFSCHANYATWAPPLLSGIRCCVISRNMWSCRCVCRNDSSIACSFVDDAFSLIVWKQIRLHDRVEAGEQTAQKMLLNSQNSISIRWMWVFPWTN